MNDQTWLGSVNLARLKALSAYICMLRSSINFDLDPLNVGFPHSVGSSMRMAHIVAKMSALSTN